MKNPVKLVRQLLGISESKKREDLDQYHREIIEEVERTEKD